MNYRHGATSPFISRLACVALALTAATAWSDAARSDDLPDRCAVPLSWDVAAPDSAAFWRDDRNISILRRIEANEYKRKQLPIGLKVTEKSFGYGRKMPIVKDLGYLSPRPGKV